MEEIVINHVDVFSCGIFTVERFALSVFNLKG